MNALMISLDSSLITQPEGSAAVRHAEFAERAGSLTILVRAPHGQTRTVGALTLIPVIGHPLMFAVNALRAARTITQTEVIIAQDLWLTALVGLRLRARLNAPLLVQNHSSIFSSDAWLAEHPIRNRVLAALARWTLPQADFYRPVNQQERDHYVQHGGDPARVIALPLGTASQAFAAPVSDAQRTAARERLGAAPDDKLILWVGYPVAFKRVPLLLETFKRVLSKIPNARLALVGDLTQSRDDLPALARALGVAERVTFGAPIPHAELPAIYQAADAYAMTSSREGVPRVLIEASAAGLPIAAFDAPGVNEVIRDGENGLLAQNADLDALAANLIQLLTDREIARRLGENARRIALNEYAAETYPDRWVGVWRAAVQAGRKS